MRIAVLSDTHNFLDRQIPKLFAGVDHILHGGDIGMPIIVLELEQIAPVTAVGGTDTAISLFFQYPGWPTAGWPGRLPGSRDRLPPESRR